MFSKKSDRKKSLIRSYVTIDPYVGTYYQYKEDVLHPLHKLTYNTSQFITSYVSTKDIITTPVYISRSIPEEDIDSVLDIKAYEELGLDQANSYIITYYEVPSEEEERMFHLFVVDPDKLHLLFDTVREQTKYIDLILPAPLLFRPLYTKEVLESYGVDCFIYFSKDDAFITFYKNGEYLYSKSIDYSLNQIYEKFCEILGEKVDEKEFFTVLETEGLKTVREEYQQNLMKIFGDLYIAINDVFIYVKRAFRLDTIDHIYIGSEVGTIIGLDEYSQNYLGLSSSDMMFHLHVRTDEWQTSPMHSLMLLGALEYHQGVSDLANLTTFPRPPAFVNRPSGQFIIMTLLATTLALAYPLYYLVNAYLNEATTHALRFKERKLAQEANHYKKIIAQKKEKVARLDEKLQKLKKRYDDKTKTLRTVYDKKVNYLLKSGLFYELAEILVKHGVNVDKVGSDGNTVFLSLISLDDRKITQLIQDISHTYFDRIETIDIEMIEKDENAEFYRGILKVVFK